MRVQNFEDEFYPTTLEEGKQLYKNDAIVDFDIPSFNIFDIVVQGSALYKVRIGVDEKKDDTIYDITCTCATASIMPCMHKAAALYVLRELFEADVFGKAPPWTEIDGTFVKTSTFKKEFFNDPYIDDDEIFTLLKTKSKEELIEYVRLVANPLDACFDLAFHFFEESKNRETEWKEDVQRLDLLLKGILLYFKNGIKINTSNYNNALVKVTSLQDAARLRGEWKYSLHISTLLLEHYRAFKILHLEIEELFFPNILLQLDLLIKTYSSSEKEALYIYKHLEKELDAFYETLSYSEMLKILTIMTPLAIEQTIREAVKGLINYYLSDMSEDESVINDYHDAFLLIQYLIIRAYESDDELARYEAFYSYSPLITKYAIERAIEEGRYIQALHLAQNAEENAPTTLSSKKWRDMTLEIEKKMGLGDEEWLKNIKEALFTYNDIEFFIRLKNQTEKEKWDTEVDSILSTLYEKTKGEKSFTDSHKLIGSIYIEENRMNDLLILTQKHRGAITFYYKHLYIDYPKEVHEILEFFIFKIASGKANNISYQKVMMLLDMLIEANGKHLAFSFVQRLRNAYKSRRNLMDLLKKYDEVDTSPTLF